MKLLTCIWVLSLFLIMSMSGCASFPHMNSGVFEVETADVEVTVAFSDNDRRLIRDYYRNKKGLPPGLAKKETLPPGLQKQLRKNGTLPPGLAKRNLPYLLEEQLSRIPQGYIRLKVGGNVIIMNEKTEIIVDILHDVG